ncbi:diguanylate cyclase (GGDEF) domain-containing protein [Modestobacter sp. DSM 44400]|uniref:GGDEF domain-containing protein n=1 Tax=Modestobacter sp. DSM 44400 TaxID=1550230 RepID=UPI00089783BD|nr:GGDEF domain-containing protein [Modestobacter sp. DSM 44400]SDY39715.1 diguanylate cyclase (GGDEF) domain-containing protein [Modestobacter sp. DSM 44400]
MRGRHPQAVARTAVPIILVCAVVPAAFTTFGPNSASATTRAATWFSVLLLFGPAAVFAFVPPGSTAPMLCSLALGGVVLVDVMNVVTQDPSAAAQAFLSFPVLWAAAHLRRGAVFLVLALSVVTDAVVLGLLLPFAATLTDFALSGTVLVVIAVMLVRAADEQRRLIALLQHQAAVDSLTGLVNRRVLDAALDRAINRPAGAQGAALLLVDVDSFKSINDQYGHPIGDEALVHVTSVLRSVVRTGDGVLSRMRGDELAVLLPEWSSDVAVRRAGEVRQAVRGTPLQLPDGTLLAMSVSLGVAHAPAHATGLEELYAAADAALYAAKRGGRDRVAVAAGGGQRSRRAAPTSVRAVSRPSASPSATTSSNTR